MQQRIGGKQRNKEKEGIGNGKKIRNIFRFTNEFIDTFFERNGDEEETKRSDLVNSNCDTELAPY